MRAANQWAKDSDLYPTRLPTLTRSFGPSPLQSKFAKYFSLINPPVSFAASFLEMTGPGHDFKISSINVCIAFSINKKKRLNNPLEIVDLLIIRLCIVFFGWVSIMEGVVKLTATFF